MVRVMTSALVLVALSSCGETAMTTNDSPPPATAQSAEAVQAPIENVASSEGPKSTAKAPASPAPDRPANAPPPSKVIQRSPLEPPAEIDPVPPPVEGTEPASQPRP